MNWTTPKGKRVHGFLKKNELIREDGLRIERICEHGVGHPIGSTGIWREWMGLHGCDGCCRKAEFYLGANTDFCRACGASIPPIEGEGTCEVCDPEGVKGNPQLKGSK